MCKLSCNPIMFNMKRGLTLLLLGVNLLLARHGDGVRTRDNVSEGAQKLR